MSEKDFVRVIMPYEDSKWVLMTKNIRFDGEACTYVQRNRETNSIYLIVGGQPAIVELSTDPLTVEGEDFIRAHFPDA